MVTHSNNISRKSLEIFLQNIEKISSYKINLEQYPTDSYTASFILWNAYFDGNIAQKNVIDLGTGNGILAMGSVYLGAASVTAVDIDPEAIEIARRNSIENGLNINFKNCDVSDISGEYDTVIMNPPYGSVNRHADLPFIKKAFEIGYYIYSIHNFKSLDFVRKLYEECGEIIRMNEIEIAVPHIYQHHKKDLYHIKSVLIYAKSKKHEKII